MQGIVPSYSFGHRWVGVISGAEPPPVATLITLAHRRTSAQNPDLTPAPVAGAGIGPGSPSKHGDHAIPLDVWRIALFDVIGADGRRKMREAQDLCQSSLIRQRRASGRRGQGQRELRSLKGKNDPKSLAKRAQLKQEVEAAIHDYSQARDQTQAAIKEMEAIVAAAWSTLRRFSVEDATAR